MRLRRTLTALVKRRKSLLERSQRDKPLRVITIGRLPPPVGGVNSSIQSLLRASAERSDVSVELLDWTQMWKLPFYRPDFLHLHFSKPGKRALGSFIGVLSNAKVVHTIHSNNFNFRRVGNRLATGISSGFILLNEDILDRFRAKNLNNSSLMTPIISNSGIRESSRLKPDLEDWLQNQKGSVAIVYCYDRSKYNGSEVYGFSFVAKLLPRLNEMNWSVLFLDPNGHYSSEELFPEMTPNAFLHSSHVEFVPILQHATAYLRPTATDGNSVAVLEALAAGVPVIASDVVPRPRGVKLYKFGDEEKFLQVLRRTDELIDSSDAPRLTSFDEYLAFLGSLSS
jgi:hypothetical protein